MDLAGWLFAKGMTQQEFAEACGVSRTTVSGWCRGAIPNGDLLTKVYSLTRGAVTPQDFADMAPEK
jgi:transcriptional regulator with XRE-family HTH domain